MPRKMLREVPKIGDVVYNSLRDLFVVVTDVSVDSSVNSITEKEYQYTWIGFDYLSVL